MRNILLALILALTALTAGLTQASAMDGFDLGDMPPLPPPLLDDSPSAPPLTPPPSGTGSPLVQGGTATPPAPALTPPPMPGGGLTPPAATPAAPAPSLLPPAGLSGGTLAPPPLPTPTPTATPVALNETPLPGKVTGGRVNVRAGPNIQYEAIAVLPTGTPVTVLAKHGDWYKIIFPADQLASIHKNFVDAEISGEIPETGLPGTVNQDGSDVHAFYWDKSTVVGKLQRGDPVTIKQERGQWYRIVPPASARAYVFAEYVRVDGGAAQVAADAVPAPENPNVDLAGGDGGPVEVKLSKLDIEANKRKEAYFKGLQESYARQVEEEEAAAKAAQDRLKNQAQQLDLALKDLDERLKSIDEETGQRLGYISNMYNPVQTTVVGSAAWAPPDPAYGGYTGWVENIGRVGGMASNYRLTKGGELRFYLRSDQYNLEDFVGRRVWLNGGIEPAAGGSASLLNVTQIRVLTELEIAETMQGQPYAAPQSYYGSTGGVTYDATGSTTYSGDVYGSQPYTPDPYGSQPYTPGPAGVPMGAPTHPAPGAPSDPSQLPDIVGYGGQTYSSSPSPLGGPVSAESFNSSRGEVESDYYEQPVISEIAP